jgi:hypothetical protein
LRDLKYAGIGSRDTPKDILLRMTRFAKCASNDGYVLRSGAAAGADEAFECGSTNSEIYLPVYNFRNSKSSLHEISKDCILLAKQFHPSWNRLSDFAKLLIARNGYQILGYDLNSPSKFVICWTQDGCEDGSKTTALTGGTGQALRIATHFNVPIFNMQRSDWINRFIEFNNELNASDE